MNADQCAEVARLANVIVRWCGVRDVQELGNLPQACGRGAEGESVDLFVLFGGGVIGLVDELARAMQTGVARQYAIVGGRGRATYWLDEAFAHKRDEWNDPQVTSLEPYVASEAEMLDAVLRYRYGLQADFLETRSTNCGNNITYLLDMLEERGFSPTSVVLCQDAIMQRRMGATWQRQASERTAFSAAAMLNWAAYEAELACAGGQLTWSRAPEGIWPMDVYLKMLMGEVERLTDDEQGYGPRGRDFVAHVDVPAEVRAAHDGLCELLGGRGVAPDDRYA